MIIRVFRQDLPTFVQLTTASNSGLSRWLSDSILQVVSVNTDIPSRYSVQGQCRA